MNPAPDGDVSPIRIPGPLLITLGAAAALVVLIGIFPSIVAALQRSHVAWSLGELSNARSTSACGSADRIAGMAPFASTRSWSAALYDPERGFYATAGSRRPPRRLHHERRGRAALRCGARPGPRHVVERAGSPRPVRRRRGRRGHRHAGPVGPARPSLPAPLHCATCSSSARLRCAPQHDRGLPLTVLRTRSRQDAIPTRRRSRLVDRA